jgi:hypothetical protein
MSTPLSQLLIEAPAARHFAQFYRELEPLGRAVSTFVETGLRRGEAVILVTGHGSGEACLQNLRDCGIDPGKYRKGGQLIEADAEYFRGVVMRGDRPDRDAFQRAVTSTLDSVLSAGYSSIRLYGEMVNLLWRDGLGRAAVQVEEFWNEMMLCYPLSVFCAYLLDKRDAPVTEGLDEICRRHTDVILGGPERLFEGSPRTVPEGEFGINIGEINDRAGDDDVRRAPTRLWLMGES